jgi:hypothetical protein
MILMPITLYLMVFYISASYSAFFKNFETSSLNAAIFDADALGQAWRDGWLEFVFVLTIPFAFMGLGYLIHMFRKEKALGNLKIASLIVVTFIFDAILAYQIEKKIYDFEKTLDSPPFDLAIAIQQVPFWGIIFAGFVVYIIWGLVFDFVMKEYEDVDKVKSFIRTQKEKKRISINEREHLQVKMNVIKQEITIYKSKVRELQSKIDGFIFNSKKYRLYHTEFCKGWELAIMEQLRLTQAVKDEMIRDCQQVSSGHLAKYGVNDYSKDYLIANAG